MNPEIKQKWIAALRSGEYKQGKGGLRNTEGYCCLGVLCDLHAKETGNEWERAEFDENDCYLRASGYLPAEVSAWAGLSKIAYDRQLAPYTLPFFDVPVVADGQDMTLSQLNDANKPFAAIADVIEAQL
jgi:hypothetical protein